MTPTTVAPVESAAKTARLPPHGPMRQTVVVNPELARHAAPMETSRSGEREKHSERAPAEQLEAVAERGHGRTF